jgi:multicomponent Na+:H+ antiporter subunit E
MKPRLILFAFMFIIWILLGGNINGHNVIAGLLVAGVITLVMGNLFASTPHYFGRVTKYLWFLWYAPVFAWECLKANIDVAARILSPSLPINPGIIKVKTTIKSDIGLTILANSITLTPGTLCVDIDIEKGFLYIHCIDVGSYDMDKYALGIVDKFEGILKRIFY